MNGNSTENGIVNVTVNVVLMFMQMFLLMLRLFSMFMVMLTCIFNVHVDDSHVHVALQNNHTRTESRAKASKGKKSKGKNKSDGDCLGDLPPMMLFLLFTSLSPIRHFSLPKSFFCWQLDKSTSSKLSLKHATRPPQTPARQKAKTKRA